MRLLDGVYLIEVHYDGYESGIIAVAATLEGAQQAASDWYKDTRHETPLLEWWQPQAGIWKADSGLSVDSITIERWTLFEDTRTL